MIDMSVTMPWRCLSSGMWAIPAAWRPRGDSFVMSRPASDIAPCATRRMPAIASTSSVCPLPCTPAMPTISPVRTLNDTSSTTVRPSASTTEMLFTPSITSPGCAVALSTTNCTARPTIISAMESSVAFLGSASPTTLPRRNTLMRSAMERASFSLWVMKITPRPESTNERTIAKNSKISLGVSTAVGSSNTTIFASRMSTLTISTR